MKAFFEYIKAYIIANVSDFAASTSIRMWNNQFEESNVKRKEKAFRYPACFVEFIFEQADNRSLSIVDYVMTIRFHLGVENMTYERKDTFDFVDRFCSALQLMAPSIASGLIFTTFQEVARGSYEDSFDNVEVLTVDFRSRVRYTQPYITKHTLTVKPGPIDQQQIISIGTPP